MLKGFCVKSSLLPKPLWVQSNEWTAFAELLKSRLFKMHFLLLLAFKKFKVFDKNMAELKKKKKNKPKTK